MASTYKLLTNFNFVFLVLFFFVMNLSLSSQTSNDDIKQNELLNQVEVESNRLKGLLSGSSFNSFTIQAGELDEAEIKFGSDKSYYSFKTRGKKEDFLISKLLKPVASINKDNDFMSFAKTVEAKNGLEFSGELKYRGFPQWRLVFEEDFSQENLAGWSKMDITECGGVRMLGGYCKLSGGEVTKTYENLPPHNNLRVEATFHFIDSWDNEAGFMRINNGKDKAMEYIWTERYSAFKGSHGINVCGGRWPEGKFSSKIDVSIPHKDNSVKLGFGATLEQDACDESFGVSGIRLYIK